MIYLLFYTIINIFTFIIILVDKVKAKKDLWRIPEKTIFFLNYLGGCFGAILGMHIFRHKTNKWYFYVNFYLAAIIHGSLIAVLISKYF